MGRRLHATTAGVVVLGWGVAGAAALALTGPDAGASAAPPPSVPTHAATPGPSRIDGSFSLAADRARLARLRDETARLEREVRILEVRLARRPARTATSAATPAPTRSSPTAPARTSRPTSAPVPAPARAPAPAPRTTTGGDHDGERGDD